jgi:HEAT repeat protein
LIRDDVAAVRNDALLSFACVMDASELPFVDGLSRSSYWRDRLTVAQMIGYFVDALLSDALPILVRLCRDAVPNVRVSAGRSMKSAFQAFPQSEAIAVALENLKTDSDCDVRVAYNC